MISPLRSALCFLCWFLIIPVETIPQVARTGPSAEYQRARELTGGFVVLSISLQPGSEDLPTLAYLRMGRGARVVSAYVTNGGEAASDVATFYPADLAALRREEATAALSVIDAEPYFLGMPDVAAARDSARVRIFWPGDSVGSRLTGLLSTVRPDLILLSADREAMGEQSPRHEVLRADLLALLDGGTPHRVRRVLEEGGESGGAGAPVGSRHPVLRKTYEEIGADAGEAYRSLAHQRTLWAEASPGRSYSRIFPATGGRVRTIDQGLPEPPPAELQSLWKSLQEMAATIQKYSQGSGRLRSRPSLLRSVAAYIDSVEQRLRTPVASRPGERRLLIAWKSALENLRATLLGIEVQYTLTESVLTELQVTHLTIDSIRGLSEGGTVELYFPGVDEEWVVNEDLQKRLPLVFGEAYRILSPRQVVYTHPQAMYGLREPTVTKPFPVFVIHQHPSRERSFLHRFDIPVSFAPRFTAEILTPIVRVVPGERLILRLTNNTRDGVGDIVAVYDPLVHTDGHPFILNTKGKSHQDTLLLEWNPGFPEGDHLIPIGIGGIQVGRFVARNFEAKVDTTRRIALVTPFPSGPTAETLRRLGLTPAVFDLDATSAITAGSFDVLLVDHRAVTFMRDPERWGGIVEEFARAGGHAIVLSQDARIWNVHPLFGEVTLAPTIRLDPDVPVTFDAQRAILREPNVIGEGDFDYWLSRRGHNSVKIQGDGVSPVAVAVRETGNPLLVSFERGKGRVTYVDLALQHQWLNIHGGAFRLLANLVSR